jgi:hypothetical protein
MSTLTNQSIVAAGLEATYAACAGGGDDFVNSGKDFIHIKNGHTSPQTVTINSQAACNQGFDHDIAVEVTNGEERLIGPFPKDRFNNASDKVLLTYSGVTALTIAILRLP